MDDLGDRGLVLTSEDSKMTISYLEGRISLEEYSAYMESRSANFYPTASSDDGGVMPFGSDMGDNESEMDFWDSSAPGSSKKAPEERGPRSRLPKDLQGLVGEANLKFARGEYQEAIAMCNEVIRLAPNANEPYQTLSLLYEECGDMEKSLQCGLLGAYLNPRCIDEWHRLAEMAEEMSNPKQAALCYRQIVRRDRSNLEIMWTSYRLDIKLDEQRRAADTLKRMLGTEQALTDGPLYFHISRELAKRYHGTGQTAQGIACLEAAIEKHPEAFTSEDVNLLAELYIASKLYNEAIKLLTKHCAVVFEVPATAKDGDVAGSCGRVEQSATCIVPPGLPIDLRTKLIVSFINIQLHSLAQSLLGPLMDESPDDMGDLYLDVAEAFLDNENHAAAKPILCALVNSSKYNMAAVWLHYAECVSALAELPEAVDAYRKVIDLVPSYVDARIALSLLLQRLGQHDEALSALSFVMTAEQSETSKYAGQESRLIFHTCLLLHGQQCFDEFIEATRYLLFGQFPRDFIAQNATVLMTAGSKHHFKVLTEKYGNQFSAMRNAPALTGSSPLDVDEMWDLYMKACYILDAQKDYNKLMEFALLGLATAKFAFDQDKHKELTFICIVCQVLLQNGKNVFNFIRHQMKKEYDSHQFHNLLSIGINLSKQDVCHVKFADRQLVKHRESIPFRLTSGHSGLLSGSYRTALNEYSEVYPKMSDDPLLNMLIGICFVHLASQHFASNRSTLVVQACGFFQKYLKLRGHCQEAYYNLGRAMQQLSLYHVAVYYYEKALELGVPAVSTATADDQALFDLSKEAAFNLAHILRLTGSDILAQQLYERHCVI